MQLVLGTKPGTGAGDKRKTKYSHTMGILIGFLLNRNLQNMHIGARVFLLHPKNPQQGLAHVSFVWKILAQDLLPSSRAED